ncbi:MAG: ATP-dependent DNA helicase RecG [Anaerotruncus sp.]|nr:ATP-dependent DNA helicase RecG [Anaerotruncus sp.]
MQATESIQKLRGVGTQRIAQLEKLGIRTIGELLLHYPRAYIDLSAPFSISGAPYDQPCVIRAKVLRKYPPVRLHTGISLYRVQAADESASLELTFFNTKFAVDQLDCDTAYLFYGRAEGSLLHRTMSAPQIYPLQNAHPYQPVYPLTAGLSNKVLFGLITQALQHKPQLPELLPEALRQELLLDGINEGIFNIHLPQNADQLTRARRRLMFEELFTLAVGIGLLRTQTRNCRALAMQPCSMQPFYAALPFTLTGAQQRAITELLSDLQGTTPMNRLVQGDVGSGKTMVAAAGAYFVAQSGAQSALMAPTELLARQHYEGLSSLCGSLGMRIGLLTGSMTAAQKRKVRQQLEAGEIDLCVGTHALLSEGVSFHRLALVITDEQHRFGVAQRAALQQKGEHPHTLVMSATPIPRTLALMVYGELDVSVIDELPPNRQPVKTYKISSGKRERAFGFIRQHLDRGLQAYIVCPLVASGEVETGLQAATDYAAQLSSNDFSGYCVSLLHGKMSASEKERVMAGFQAGSIQLLVSTTVIEVGVDVPNAVIMMIENAERFGLSQLHQLRGRVGRGSEQSHCILLSDTRSPDTLERLMMMCRSNNGFEIAEYDLKTRGPGNFLGQQQHGLPKLRIADLTTEPELVAQAQAAAQTLLHEDPALSQPAHQPLRQACEQLMDAVGERPN